MPTLTALLHTENDALRVGRALETLFPCHDIVVIDHASSDATIDVAHEYGARVIKAAAESTQQQYLPLIRPGWIFCLDPRESMTESLAATLFDWRSGRGAEREAARAFSVCIREETQDGWITLPLPQTRLVPTDWKRWKGWLPVGDESAITLEGELLCFRFP